MCGGGLLFPVMSGFAKFLGEDGYSSLQVSWARAFGHIVFMLVFFVPKFGVRMLRTRRPWFQIVRSSMLFTLRFISPVLSFIFAVQTFPFFPNFSNSLTSPFSTTSAISSTFPILGFRSCIAILYLWFFGYL